MRETLMDNINQYGHMRINYRPTGAPANLTLPECESILRDNVVMLRGWDYPHVAIRNDEYGGTVIADQYFETWCKWSSHIEFSRLYRSGQFISYRAIHEDIEQWPRAPEGLGLETTGAVYSITEIFEHAFRLHRSGLYQEGLELNVRWYKMNGRKLFVSDFNRMPFSYPQTATTDTIELTASLSPTELSGSSLEHSNRMALELFYRFTWKASKDAIMKTQEDFFNRRS